MIICTREQTLSRTHSTYTEQSVPLPEVQLVNDQEVFPPPWTFKSTPRNKIRNKIHIYFSSVESQMLEAQRNIKKDTFSCLVAYIIFDYYCCWCSSYPFPSPDGLQKKKKTEFSATLSTHPSPLIQRYCAWTRQQQTKFLFITFFEYYKFVPSFFFLNAT